MRCNYIIPMYFEKKSSIYAACVQTQPPARARLHASESGGGGAWKSGSDAHEEEAGAGHERTGVGARLGEPRSRWRRQDHQEAAAADARTTAAGCHSNTRRRPASSARPFWITGVQRHPPPASRKSPGNTFESGGTCPVRSAGKKIFLVVPFHCFDSKSTISRFGERLRDGQYSLVSFLFAVLSLTMPSCPAICKVGARAPRALWSRRHWGQKQESWGGQNLFDVYV